MFVTTSLARLEDILCFLYHTQFTGAREGRPLGFARSGMSSLWNAAFDGDTAEVRKLIAHGVDINWTNSWGQSSIWVACQNGKTDTVAVLLDSGADHALADKKAGKTPLEIAKLKKHADVIVLLEQACIAICPTQLADRLHYSLHALCEQTYGCHCASG